MAARPGERPRGAGGAGLLLAVAGTTGGAGILGGSHGELDG